MNSLKKCFIKTTLENEINKIVGRSFNENSIHYFMKKQIYFFESNPLFQGCHFDYDIRHEPYFYRSEIRLKIRSSLSPDGYFIAFSFSF